MEGLYHDFSIDLDDFLAFGRTLIYSTLLYFFCAGSVFSSKNRIKAEVASLAHRKPTSDFPDRGFSFSRYAALDINAKVF